MDDQQGDLQLATERLVLRRIGSKDLTRIAALLDDEALARTLDAAPFPYALEDAERFLAQARKDWGLHSFTFGIYLKAAPDDIIGVATLNSLTAFVHPSPSLGYWLGRDYWGQGLATDATGALVKLAFEQLNAANIEATFLKDNPASGRVLEKNGFQVVQETLLWSRYHRRYLDGMHMKLERTAFEQARQ